MQVDHSTNIDLARLTAEQIERAAAIVGLPAARVSLQADGYVVVFRSGRRGGDVECFDNGETIAVVYDQHGQPRAWDVDMDDDGIRYTLEQIRRYIEPDTAN